MHSAEPIRALGCICCADQEGLASIRPRLFSPLASRVNAVLAILFASAVTTVLVGSRADNSVIQGYLPVKVCKWRALLKRRGVRRGRGVPAFGQ